MLFLRFKVHIENPEYVENRNEQILLDIIKKLSKMNTNELACIWFFNRNASKSTDKSSKRSLIYEKVDDPTTRRNY